MRETSPRGNDSYVAGDHNVICDVCGFQYKRSETRMRWDGLLVCSKDWEPRHPQERVRGIKERVGVDIARPDPTPTYIVTPITQDDL